MLSSRRTTILFPIAFHSPPYQRCHSDARVHCEERSLFLQPERLGFSVCHHKDGHTGLTNNFSKCIMYASLYFASWPEILIQPSRPRRGDIITMAVIKYSIINTALLCSLFCQPKTCLYKHVVLYSCILVYSFRPVTSSIVTLGFSYRFAVFSGTSVFLIMFWEYHLEWFGYSAMTDMRKWSYESYVVWWGWGSLGRLGLLK